MINHAPYHWRKGQVEWGGIPADQRFAASLERVRPQTLRLGLMAYF